MAEGRTGKLRAGLSSRHSREYSSIIDRMRTVPPSAVRPWMKGRVEAVPDVPLFLGLRKPAPPVPLEIDRLRRKLPCRWGARSPHKSSDKSDEQTAKYRKNSHDRLTLAKICVICKSLHMTHFQSTNDGAEVVGSSDSNPVRVAFFFWAVCLCNPHGYWLRGRLLKLSELVGVRGSWLKFVKKRQENGGQMAPKWH